jgi:hypothetical protein
MKRNWRTSVLATVVLVTMTAGAILALRKVETVRGKEATLEEVLYLPSGKTLKRISLGYSSLLANIYWTRAVQYFGAQLHNRTPHYDLLYPLLDITTDLDPHLIPAYQTGSIFLAQRPPAGAGTPNKGVELLQKGIRENPEYWRLYFTLGFIHYLDRRDYKAAQEAFAKGSGIPGARPSMKALAARMAERANDAGTAIALWQGLYEMTKQESVRDTALKHIASLQVDAAIDELQQRVESYRKQTGSLPANWSDLVRRNLLRGIPLDPTGAPFVLMPDGSVQVRDPQAFPFLGELRQ